MGRRLFISSDFLMTSELEQNSNLRWMLDILSRPIELGSGLEPKALLGFDGVPPSGFRRRNFFAQSGMEIGSSSTHFWFDPNRISQSSLSYLSQFLNSGDILLGYELSESTRAVLERIGVVCVDMWLHPVRFLDDVMFAMRSGEPHINTGLQEYSVSLHDMQLYADRIRVQTYKGWHRKEADIEAGSALIIGQMANDKSVCREGRFLTLLDFEEGILDLISRHSHVYFSRHPYMKEGDEEVLSFLASLPNVSLTSEPTYRLLSSPNLKTVAGISSSVLAEAKFFGKEVCYFYRPVLDFGLGEGDCSYSSIQQDFLNPRFWRSILAPVLDHLPEKASVPDVSFLDKKDKVRDMLGFYWSYWQIDKMEGMRSKPGNLLPASSSMGPGEPRLQSDRRVDVLGQSKLEILAAKRMIWESDVVSFDVFDTLLERALIAPEDLFDVISKNASNLVCEIDGVPNFDFKSSRAKARHWAIGSALGEEVLLRDRYEAIGHRCGLSAKAITALYNQEIAAEHEFCRARWIGRTLFETALKLGKRIILVSDTYFDRAVVESLLREAGYENYDRLYLSSEEGKLKATTSLFQHVLEEEGMDAEKVVHIGDNLKSDISSGEKCGLKVVYVPDKQVVSKGLSGIPSALTQVEDPVLRTVASGLALSRLTSGYLPEGRTSTGGRPGVLGYSALGLMFFGFAKWILDDAESRGVEDVYFLARDGKIVKQCYDLLAGPNAPRSHYILASRRSVLTAGISSPADVLSVMGGGASPCSLRDLLRNRFGVEEVGDLRRLAQDCGFDNLDARIPWSLHQDELRRFLSEEVVWSRILKAATEEAAELREYYLKEGLAAGRLPASVAFVDIGHAGSIQRGICDLMGLEETVGYYFSTVSEVDQNLTSAGHLALSYYADRISEHGAEVHPYRQNILMFEAAFLSPEDSFVRFRGGQPEYLGEAAVEAGRKRKALSEEMHEGVIEFVTDLASLSRKYGVSMSVPAECAVLPFQEVLTAPGASDAEIFKGVTFENTYSGRSQRWLIPPKPTKGNLGLWEAGSRVLLKTEKKKRVKAKERKRCTQPDRPEPDTVAHRIISAGVELFLPLRKRRKFRRNPLLFFRQSKSTAARVIGEGVYWRHYDN